jgi:hypothetical protein
MTRTLPLALTVVLLSFIAARAETPSEAVDALFQVRLHAGIPLSDDKILRLSKKIADEYGTAVIAPHHGEIEGLEGRRGALLRALGHSDPSREISSHPGSVLPAWETVGENLRQRSTHRDRPEQSRATPYVRHGKEEALCRMGRHLMPHPDFISTPDSLRCQLQRGRGEGYRRLLTVPEEEAHALLVDCITHDPRMDSQVESRDWYYAHAAVATDLPLEPLAEHLHAHDDSGQFSWNTPLTVMTLAELAARSYKNAREILCDYISWGEWWNWPIDDLLRISDDSLSAQVAAAVEKHFLTEERLDEAMTEWPQDDFPKLARFGPRIAASVAKATATQVPKETPFALPGSYSVQDLLDLAPTTNLGGAKQIGKAIAAIVKPSDVDVLVASVSITDPLRSHVAMAGLERLAPTHLHEWLKNLWLTVPFQPDPADKRINRIIMRQAICRLFRAFSPEATLPPGAGLV